MMHKVTSPPIWLIVLIAGLPQLCETIYSPSLPDIQRALQTSQSMVEYTLTMYLFGFSLGVFFWGKLSDHIGRKPCVIAGLFIFMLGCVGCFYATSIKGLMLSRLVQGSGGAIGSVLSQAMCRDAFQGSALGRAYSTVGTALALFPAIGPLCGGIMADTFGWQSIFIFLQVFSILLMIITWCRLPETHYPSARIKVSIMTVAKDLVRDPKVLGFGVIVAACNGVAFSYFAEGPFYLITILGLSSSHYGATFMAIALSAILGGVVSRFCQQKYSSLKIMTAGLFIIFISMAVLTITVLGCHYHLLCLSNHAMVFMTISCQMGGYFGICMATSNALALALVDYKYAIGTASSLFGFFYYVLISFFTFLMGVIHNGTLLPMPAYFLFLSTLTILISYLLLFKKLDK